MRWQGRMADDVAASRATVAHALALLDSLPRNARIYKRDREGKFSSGGYQAGSDISGSVDFDAVLAEQKAGGRTRNEDRGMDAIQKQQGFDGPPAAVSAEEFNRAVAVGELRETFRGIKGEHAEQYVEDFRSGESYAGAGLFGSGTYVSTSRAGAEHYAEGGPVVRVGLRSDARVVTSAELGRQMKQYKAEHADTSARLESLDREMRAAAMDTADNDTAGRVAIYAHYGALKDKVGAESQIMDDPGRFAAAKGYDAILTGAPSNVSVQTNDEQIVILNRTATVVVASP